VSVGHLDVRVQLGLVVVKHVRGLRSLVLSRSQHPLVVAELFRSLQACFVVVDVLVELGVEVVKGVSGFVLVGLSGGVQVLGAPSGVADGVRLELEVLDGDSPGSELLLLVLKVGEGSLHVSVEGLVLIVVEDGVGGLGLLGGDPLVVELFLGPREAFVALVDVVVLSEVGDLVVHGVGKLLVRDASGGRADRVGLELYVLGVELGGVIGV